MKLEGMYVRTDLGNIGKIVEEYTHQNNKVSYPEPQEWVLDTGYILNEAMMYKNEEITKASHNIIDLIEVGDFIDGKQVVNAIHCKDGFNRIELFGGKAIMNKTPIKLIVTKQQFERISYKVGE